MLREFIAAVSAWLRRRARRLGIRGTLKTGAVTVIQRFNSALDVAPHFHTLFMDGVYSFPCTGQPIFHPVPSPGDEDVAQIAAAVFRRVERKIARREAGLAQRRFLESAPLLVALVEASARGVIATGPRRGCRVVRVRGIVSYVDGFVMGRLCAQVEGYNLQAATRIAANDRDGVERMARYLARPPIAADRLTQLDDGRIELRLKRPWRDGTTAFRYSPHESEPPAPPGTEAPKRPGRFPWASLIWRVFLENVLSCTRCSGRMAIVAAVTSPLGVARVLKFLGLPTEPPPLHAPRPPPQVELAFEAAPAFEADPPAPDGFDS